MEKINKETGWKEVCISSGEHLERTVEMYKELGFEIYLKRLKPEELEGCSICYDENEKVFKLFARKI